MKKNRIEKTIIKIFSDFEEGNLPDELNEWFIKYMPERNRKNISNEERCIANTHKRERCIKKIYEYNDYLCFQHYHIYKQNRMLHFGLSDENKKEKLKKILDESLKE